MAQKQSTKARIGSECPNLSVSEWVQGEPTNIDVQKGRVMLIDVIQVNCPGCFLFALPEAISLHEKYHERGLSVVAVATAFEDFESNSIENLRKFIETSEVQGATLRALSQCKRLVDGNKYPHRIPFPVAMDSIKVIRPGGHVTDEEVNEVIQQTFSGGLEAFRTLYTAQRQETIASRIKEHLATQHSVGETFQTFALQGTPSSIVVDKRGILRHIFLGEQENGGLEKAIKQLLDE